MLSWVSADNFREIVNKRDKSFFELEKFKSNAQKDLESETNLFLITIYNGFGVCWDSCQGSNLREKRKMQTINFSGGS